ncbi:MAG: histidine kinase dimerization/phospho-acceptor domain-containing protein, partial [Lysinibacillus sp.]
MQNKTIYTLLFLLLLLTFPLHTSDVFAATTAPPSAENGKLDLQHWVPSTSSENIALEGEWAFYWNKLLTPEEIKNSTIAPLYVQTPAQWSKLNIDGQTFPHEGYATYHLNIRLNENALNEPIALKVPSSGSTYKVWINGQLLAQSGTVGTTKEQETPWTTSQIIYFTSDKQTLDLVVQVSNFHKRRNGMSSPFIIGHPDTTLLESFFHGTTLKLMFIGSLLIIGVFFFFTYFFRRQNSIALLSSCCAFIFCIRLIVTDDYILLHYFPESSFATVYTLEYLMASLGMLFLVLYISKLFPNEKHRFIPKLIITFSAGYSLFILVTPPEIFTYTIHFQFLNLGLVGFYHLFYVYPLAIYRKKRWALSNFLAILFVVLTLINDWFYYIENTASMLLHYISMFIFFVIQIVTVAHQLGQAHKQLEDLTNELTHVNTNLEHIVDERTKKLLEVNMELAASNEKLKNVEISRRKLLSNISHDIGTPMQSALGFVEMLSSGQIKDNQQKYLDIVHNKLLFMTRLTNDLFDLVKIDENQITYDFKEIRIQDYYESIEQQFAHDFTKHNIHFVVEPLPPFENLQQA